LWALAVGAAGLAAGRYWIPLDAGTLGQSAERVFLGQLPHRDFQDPYTGLGAMLGAVAFRLFGISLSSLRIPLVAGFAVWLPAVLAIARRFARPATAVGLAALAATASVLAYPEAMPTWYGLYLGTWALVALLRFVDGGGRGWLVAAGGAAGAAILFKVVGLYVVAAALLTLAYHRPQRGLYGAICVGAGGVFAVLLARLVLPGTGPGGAYLFFAPGAALTAVAVLPAPSTPRRGGFRALLLDGGALLAGVLAPLAVFSVPYLATGSMHSLLEGALLLPSHRLSSPAASAPPSLSTALPALAAAALLALSGSVGNRTARGLFVGVLALLAAALALDDALGGAAVLGIWRAARAWIPALALWGAWLLWRTPSAPSASAYAVLVTAALWSLVQFPYPAPGYFFYVAPLAVLATAAVLEVAGKVPPGLPSLYAVAFFLMAGGFVQGVLGSATHRLALDRGGLRVSEADARLYGTLIPLVRQHAAGRPILATPDAPEVYFLTGLENPTPVIYEFLDPSPPSAAHTLRLLDTRDVRVVVLNTRPLFSQPTDPTLREGLSHAFPEHERVGPFVVRWRGAPAAGPP